LQREIGMRAQLLQVVPGAEALAFGGEHHHPDVGRLLEAIDLGLQRADHGLRKRVITLAAIERERADAVANLRQHVRDGDVFAWSVHVVHSMADAERARSRRMNFWILPVDVFGSSPNTTDFGALNRA